MSKEGKPQSKLPVVFMLIIIPVVIILILAVVLLKFTEFNMGDRVENALNMLPFIETREEVGVVDFEMEEKLVQLEHENSTYLATIDQLETELQQQELLLLNLEEELNELKSEPQLEETELEEYYGDLNDVVKTLEGMTASKAAPIVEEMDEDEAVMYLRMMKVDSRAQILSRIDPAKAAALISKLPN